MRDLISPQDPGIELSVLYYSCVSGDMTEPQMLHLKNGGLLWGLNYKNGWNHLVRYGWSTVNIQS